MELGRRMGGSEGGCRQDQRAVLIRAFEGRWRSGDRGRCEGEQGPKEEERERERERAAVHASGGGQGEEAGMPRSGWLEWSRRAGG